MVIIKIYLLLLLLVIINKVFGSVEYFPFNRDLNFASNITEKREVGEEI